MIVGHAYFDEFEFFFWFYWKCEGFFALDGRIELKSSEIKAFFIMQVL